MLFFFLLASSSFTIGNFKLFRSDQLANDMIEFNERLDSCFEILMKLDRGNGNGESS